MELSPSAQLHRIDNQVRAGEDVIAFDHKDSKISDRVITTSRCFSLEHPPPISKPLIEKSLTFRPHLSNIPWLQQLPLSQALDRMLPFEILTSPFLRQKC